MGIVNDQTLDAILHEQLKEQIFAVTPASPRRETQSGQQEIAQGCFLGIVFGSGYSQHRIAPSTNGPCLAAGLIPQIANAHRLARTWFGHNDMPAASMPRLA